MSDERADLILNMLRSIRAEQAAQREKLDEIISRIGALEREVATLTLRFAEMKVDFANLSVRIDISITVSDASSSAWSWSKFLCPADAHSRLDYGAGRHCYSGCAVQRRLATLSSARDSTQRSPSGVSSRFQNGASVFSQSIRN